MYQTTSRSYKRDIETLLFKYFTERFICSLDRLLDLAEGKCRHENCTSLGVISYKLCGCCVAIHITCQNGHTYRWESSHSQVNTNGSKTYSDNLDFASAILLSGNNFTKIKSFSQFSGSHTICKTTYHTYQKL